MEPERTYPPIHSLSTLGEMDHQLSFLRQRSAQVREELFELSCELQRDPEAVDLHTLWSLSTEYRAIEERKEWLEWLLSNLEPVSPPDSTAVNERGREHLRACLELQPRGHRDDGERDPGR